MITNNITRSVAITLWLLCLAHVTCAETIYDQPYLGVLPEFFRERFSAEAWRR